MTRWISVKRNERRRERKREKRNRQKERKSKKRKASKTMKTRSSDSSDEESKKEIEEAIKKVRKDWKEAEKIIQLVYFYFFFYFIFFDLDSILFRCTPSNISEPRLLTTKLRFSVSAWETVILMENVEHMSLKSFRVIANDGIIQITIQAHQQKRKWKHINWHGFMQMTPWRFIWMKSVEGRKIEKNEIFLMLWNLFCRI